MEYFVVRRFSILKEKTTQKMNNFGQVCHIFIP